MTQESSVSTGKESNNDNVKQREKRDRNVALTKVVIRRLPPSMTLDVFTEQVSPLPEHDYIYFIKADMSLAPHCYSRAYVNFVNQDDIFTFKDKFDGYVFVDQQGNEYPAVVEFSPFQKIPKKKSKKKDIKCGSIETDPDYLKFLEYLQNPEEVILPTAESYLEEIEQRERELKASNGILRVTTPLIEYIKQKKVEKMRFREEKREERRRREMERKRQRDEERKRRKADKEKEKTGDKNRDSDKDDGKKSESEKTKSEPVLKLLRNPERDKDDIKEKDFSTSIRDSRDKSSRPMSDWEKERRRRDEERQRQRDKQRDRERERRDKERMGRRNDNRQSTSKYQDWRKDDSRGFKDSVDDKSEDKDRVKKADIRTKSSSGYDHQWNKNRRWEIDDRFNRRGSAGSKSFDRKGDFSRKSQEWKHEKREDIEKEKPEETAAETKKTEKDSKSRELVEDREKKPQEETLEESEEVNSDDKKTDEGREGGKQDPRTERRIKNKDRPSLELYRPGMRRLQRASPQKDVVIGSASSSSSPSPTPNLLAKGFSHEEDKKCDLNEKENQNL